MNKNILLHILLVVGLSISVFADTNVAERLYVNDERVTDTTGIQVLNDSKIIIKFKVENGNNFDISSNITAIFNYLDDGDDVKKEIGFFEIDDNEESDWKEIEFKLNDYEVEFGIYMLNAIVSWNDSNMSGDEDFEWEFIVSKTIGESEIMILLQELNKTINDLRNSNAELNENLSSSLTYYNLYTECSINLSSCATERDSLTGTATTLSTCEADKSTISSEKEIYSNNYDSCSAYGLFS